MGDLDKIFRADDIRGAYPKELDEETAYKIGRATAKFLKTKEIIVGRDNRPSSIKLFESLCSGITDEAVNVINIGIVTTPMFYFSVADWKMKGGIMITASHNPEEDNGFKIVKNKAISISQDLGLEKIKDLIKEHKFKDKTKGNITDKDIFEDYLKHLSKFIDFDINKPLRIYVDYGQSMAEKILLELFKNKQIELTESLLDKFDFGIVFDRDGDRVFFIDENSNQINPDIISALIVNRLFHKAGKILYPIAASMVFKEEILDNNNQILYSKIGHAFVKEVMEKNKAIFGAESSGHYYFKDGCILESPITALIKIIGIILKENKPFSHVIQPFQKYSLERINIKSGKFSQLKEKLENKYQKTGEISRLDGIKAEFPDWWFSLRSSNTESVMRLTIEAKTKELLKEKKQELSKLIPFSL